MPRTALSQADAAAIVLRDARKPMHRNEITQEILRRGLDVWSGSGPGDTPWESVGRAITQEIIRLGDHARFEYERKGSGVFRLRDANGDPRPDRQTGRQHPKKSPVWVEMPSELLERLDDECARAGVSRDEFVNRALQRQLWFLDQKQAEEEWSASYREQPPDEGDDALARTAKYLAEPWEPS